MKACRPKRREEKRERECTGESRRESGRVQEIMGERGRGREGERQRGREGERQKGREAEKERGPQPFGFSFYMFFFFFLLSLGLPYVNWASKECCFFYLRSLVWSSGLPLFYFHGLFPYLSFSHHHSGHRSHHSHSQQKSPKCNTWVQSQKWQNDLCSFQRQTIQYHGTPSLSPAQ